MASLLEYINEWLQRLLGEELDAKIKHYFLTGAYKSILLQGAIAILTFCTALFVARITGDEGFGIYTTVFTWVSIVSVGATLGLDDLALKQLPIYLKRKEHGKIKGLLIWANTWGVIVATFCALLLYALAEFTTINGLHEHADLYFWAVWAIPLFVIMHVNQAALRGLHLFGWGQLAEKLVQPLSFFLFLLGMYWWQGYYLTDEHAIEARVLSFVITGIVAIYLVIRYTQYYRKGQAVYEKKIWWNSCRYFALTSLLYIVNTRIDIIFLSLYQIPEAEIAHYNAALKLSDMALIPFAVLYTVTAPMFSSLYASQKQEELQAFFTKTTRLACGIITLILITLVLGGEWFLALFGTSFVAGYPILLILCFTKFVHVFVGPVSYLLMMANLEKEATWALIASVLMTIGLHIYWIPLYGVQGAAYATLVGLLLFEFLVSWLSYAKAGIVPTALGRFLRTKGKSSR